MSDLNLNLISLDVSLKLEAHLVASLLALWYITSWVARGICHLYPLTARGEERRDYPTIRSFLFRLDEMFIIHS